MRDWREYKYLSINGEKRSLQGWRAYAQEALQEGSVSPVFEDIMKFVVDWGNRRDWIELRTSGSTGRPKNFRISKQQIVQSALRTIDNLGLNEGSGALLCLPNKFIGGKMMIARAVIGNLNLWLADNTSLPRVPEGTEIHLSALVPMQVSAIIRDEQASKEWKKVHNILIGGAHLDARLEEQLRLWPNRIYESFGMTETVSHVALRRVNDNGSRKPFTALPGITFARDERGCLMICSESIPNNPTITNDLVELIDDQHFHWIGRFDNVINSGGVKVIPEPIEKRIRPHFNTRFFLCGTPDEALGECVTLVLESQPLSSDEEASLLRELREELDKFEAPRAVRYLTQFSETESGKINRKQTTKSALESAQAG